MRRSTKYAGLDVHQATTSATVRESSGRIIARSVLPTVEFFAGMRGAVHVAIEEGTQAQWLRDPQPSSSARSRHRLRPS